MQTVYMIAQGNEGLMFTMFSSDNKANSDNFFIMEELYDLQPCDNISPFLVDCLCEVS